MCFDYFICITRNERRIVTKTSCSQTVIRILKRQIEHRSEIHIESQRPQDSCVTGMNLVRQTSISGCGKGHRRRNTANEFVQTLNGSPLLIYCHEHRDVAKLLKIRIESDDLIDRRHISLK